jgi:uncharacterized GH25 family protein
MSTVRGWAAAVLLGCVLAASGSAADQTKITVQVKSPYDKPVENAEVILDFIGSHQVTKLGKRKPIHWETRTNQNGIAHFPPVPQGTVQVQVYAKKYQTFGDKFDVDVDERTIDIKLNSPQPQYSAHPPLKQ